MYIRTNVKLAPYQQLPSYPDAVEYVASRQDLFLHEIHVHSSGLIAPSSRLWLKQRVHPRCRYLVFGLGVVI